MTNLRKKDIWFLLKDSAMAWNKDNVVRLGAALAFYSTFSIGPMLIIVIVMSSLGVGREAARGHLVSQIQGLIGPEEARFVQELMQNAYKSNSSIPAAVFAICSLLLGASAVFVHLRDSLNIIFRVTEKPMSSILAFIRARALSFTIIVGIGFLLLVSLLVSTVLAAASSYLSKSSAAAGFLLGAFDFLVSFGSIALAFSLILMYLPAVNIRQRDIWVGSAATSLLFSAGKLVIGYYLGTSGLGSTFGAASSLVVLMLWSFYSSQIVLFGAEFTRLFATRFGSGISPGRKAYRFGVRAISANRQTREFVRTPDPNSARTRH